MNKANPNSEVATNEEPVEVIYSTETILVPNVESESFEDWKARKLKNKSKYT